MAQPSRLLTFLGRYSNRRAASVIGAVVLLGISVVLVSRAAGPAALVEAEAAQLTGAASQLALATASGGKIIVFGTPVTAATPTPTSAPTSTPAPPPSSCATAANIPGSADPWGGCWPGPNNTGVPAGTVLTAKSGDQDVTTDGAIISGWNVNGCINILATHVVIKNSKMKCVYFPSGQRGRYCHYDEPAPLRSLSGCTVVTGISDNSNSAANDPRAVLQDSEVDCQGVPGNTGTGIGDRNITILRANIHGCENGFDVDSYVTITDSYIHDLYNSAVGDPHTDGLQSGLGASLIISHNVFYGFDAGCVYPNDVGSCNGTSAINIGGQPSQATVSNVTVNRNLLAGGAYTLYCAILKPTNFIISQNYFSTVYSPHVGEYGPSSGCANGETASGNVIYNYSTKQTSPYTPEN